MANELRYRASMKDDVSGPLDRIRDKFDRLKQQGAKGLAIGAGVALTTKAFDLMGVAASKATEFIAGSVQAASSLNETISKTRVIFGDGAEDILRWGDAAADAIGQSKRQALDAAANFKGLFDVVGIGGDQASTMAKKLTELGSDLASFFNTDVSEALAALRSGLNGETEPLRRFNVFLSETAVAAKLAEMGIKKTGGQFTEAQKALARYEIILESTTVAQGDFARTSEGLANKSRTLEANVEDLQAKIGGPLTQAATAATGAMLDLVDGMSAFLDESKPFEERVTESADGVGDFAQFVNDLLNPGLALARDKIKDAAKELEPMNDRLLDAGHAADVVAPKVEDVGDAAGGAIDPTRDLRREAAKLAKTLREDLKSAAEDTADALAESIYGPAELKGELAELRQELVDDRAELRKLEAIKNPTAEQRRDIMSTKGSIAETKAEILKTRVQLALLDGTGLDSIRKELIRLASRTDEAGDEARELLRLLNLVANVRLPTAYGSAGGIGRGGGGGRHGGGLVFPGESVTVGENGKRETLTMLGSGMGYVESGGARGSGGGVTIQLAIHPHPMATPGQAQAWAREAAPALLDEMKRRGVLRV